MPAPVRPSYAAQMHYDPTARAVLVIGGQLQLGNSIRPMAGVMRYEPTVAAESLSFGVGCPGRSDVPALTTSQLPWLGRTMRLQVAVPPGTVAFFVGGASNTATAGGQALPRSLTPFGLQGCQQLVSTQSLAPRTGSAAGIASLPLVIPNLPVLLGTTLFVQAVIPGMGTTSGLVTTNGIQLVAGSF